MKVFSSTEFLHKIILQCQPPCIITFRTLKVSPCCIQVPHRHYLTRKDTLHISTPTQVKSLRPLLPIKTILRPPLKRDKSPFGWMIKPQYFRMAVYLQWGMQSDGVSFQDHHSRQYCHLATENSKSHHPLCKSFKFAIGRTSFGHSLG